MNKRTVVGALVCAVLVAGGCGDEGGAATRTAADPRPTVDVGDAPVASPTTVPPSTAAPATAEGRAAAAPTSVGAPLAVHSEWHVFVDGSRETPRSGAAPALPTRSLDTLVLLPAGDGPYPLLVFSHGLSANPTFYASLLERVAAAGFVIVAPTFPLTSAQAPAGPDAGDTPQQPGDVSFLIDRVTAAAAAGDAPFAGLVDPQRVGAFGHSNGGITTLGVAANTCCRDDRIGAAVVLSGNSAPFGGGEYAWADAPPVLLVHGVGDELIPYEEAVRVFNELPNAKGFVSLEHVGHNELLRPGPFGFDTVLATVVDFFRAHLLGDEAAGARLVSEQVQDELADLRYAAVDAASVTLTTMPPRTGRDASVAPTTRLTDGQVVTVTWTNFTPGKVVNVVQCSQGGTGGNELCELTTARILQPNPTGDGSVALEIVMGPVGTGRCDEASTDCVVVVNDGGLLDPGATIRLPITFAS